MNISLIVELVLFAVTIVFCILAISAVWIRKKDKEVFEILLREAFQRHKVIVAFMKLDPAAKIPEYAHATDSAMDVASIDDVTILPHSFAKVRTGIAAKIPPDFEIQVRPRSGLQCRSGIVGAWGTVDEGYRGDIGVALYNHSDEPYHVSVGDRVAQIVISPVCRAKVCVVDKFDDTTDRGMDGFGSTGK